MADADATPMAVDEGAAAVVPSQPFVLPLLETIRLSQGQNGIKHGDHMRYRHHCTHRLRSLFKVLHFQHGRTKYQKRKLDHHNITDVRHLHILLFSAERCWAYAMELKKEAETQPALAARKRDHLRRRLAKAQVWAAELARFASEKCDARSALEAEGYSAWLSGNLLLEKESDWPAALSKFTRAKRVFMELAKVGTLDQQAVCLQMVEEIEPSLRYCNYQIERQGGAAPTDASDLIALGDQEGRGGLGLLQSKLAALAEESAARLAASSSAQHVFEWYGQQYPVRGPQVRSCLRQAQLVESQLAQAATAEAPAEQGAVSADGATAAAAAAPGSSTLEQQLMLLDKLSNALCEARSHVRNAAKSSAVGEGEGSAEELSALETALSGAILQRAVERSTLMERDARQRFDAGLIRHAQGKRAKDKAQFARPEDVVRCIDTLMRHLEDYADLGARSGGRRGEELHDMCAARVSICQASRCYYVAHAYLAAGKPREALALFGRTLERIAGAHERLAGLAPSSAAELAQVAAELPDLSHLATAYRTVAHAEYEAETSKATEATQAGVAGLALGTGVPQQPLGAQGAGQAGAVPIPGAPTYLIDHLDQWESFAGVTSGSAAVMAGVAAPRLLPVPQPLIAVPVRPIMLDTASGHIRYPSLDHRVKKAEKKAGGVLSSLFGWGRTAT